MISGLKRLFGGKQSRGGTASLSDRPHWNLHGKPFTAALLDRHVHEANDALGFWQEMTGNMPVLSLPDDLTHAVENAIGSTAGVAALNAMSDHGISLVHPQGDPWPKEYVTGCVFAYFVATVLRGHAMGEGVEANLTNALFGALGNLTLARSENETLALHSSALPMCQRLLKAEGQDVENWKDAAHKLVRIHVFQWGADDPKLSQIETRPLFAGLYGSLLKQLAL